MNALIEAMYNGDECINLFLDMGEGKYKDITTGEIINGNSLNFDIPNQCGFCNEFYHEPPIMSEETGLSEFCCDGCLQEALEEIRIDRIEGRRQYEMYGDDMDSWYR